MIPVIRVHETEGIPLSTEVSAVQYPNGAHLAVAINDDNGNLVGWWIWHLDTAASSCSGPNGEQLVGSFVNDPIAHPPDWIQGRA